MIKDLEQRFADASKKTGIKKVTRATIKKFIKTNWNGLYIKNKSNFNGMTDSVESVDGEFKKVEQATYSLDYNLGIKGAWFVGGSRDYFTPYADENMVGYEVYNSCGSFLLAFKKQ